MAHPFLSDEWIAAARAIHAEYRDSPAGTIDYALRMNLVVRDVPFGEGTLDAHADTSTGELILELGHLDPVDVTLTLDYETARTMLVEQDQQAAMQAFFSGRIAIDGDLARVIVLQAQLAAPDPVADEIAVRIRAITA
jgi:hypothetical protein